jgi:hypothetical protein
MQRDSAFIGGSSGLSDAASCVWPLRTSQDQAFAAAERCGALLRDPDLVSAGRLAMHGRRGYPT